MGEGRSRRRALHRAGATRDRGLAPERGRLRDSPAGSGPVLWAVPWANGRDGDVCVIADPKDRGVPCRRRARRRDDQSRLGTDHEEAAAIVTDRGGRTCHAAIIARELGIPAIVGTGNAMTCSNARSGDRVLRRGRHRSRLCGAIPIEVSTVDLASIGRPRTKIMVNVGNPDLASRRRSGRTMGSAWRAWNSSSAEIRRPSDRPRLPEKATSAADREAIVRLTRGHAKPTDFFVERLSQGVGTIAAAFHPRPVIIRLSDFKTNEYAQLLGGAAFEPKKRNPCWAFAARALLHPAYAAASPWSARPSGASAGHGADNLASWCPSAAGSPRHGASSTPWRRTASGEVRTVSRST